MAIDTAVQVATTKPPDGRTVGAAPLSLASPPVLAFAVGADEASGKGDAPPPSGAEVVDGAPVTSMGTPRDPSEAVGEEVWSGDEVGVGE